MVLPSPVYAIFLNAAKIMLFSNRDLNVPILSLKTFCDSAWSTELSPLLHG